MSTERRDEDQQPPLSHLAELANARLQQVSTTFDSTLRGIKKSLRPFLPHTTTQQQSLTIPTKAIISSTLDQKLSPEIQDRCLKNLKRNFERGIVLIEEEMSEKKFDSALQLDKTAGTNWQTIQARLLANDSALLKEAAKLQGGGELVGIYPNGKLAIIDAADENGNREPVIIAFDANGNRLTITADTPNRKELIQQISNGEGRFANYWEIRNAVLEDGYTLAPDSPKLRKEGIIAAVQAITGKPFIHSKNDNEWCDAILDCGDNVTANTNSFIRTAYFSPTFETTGIDADSPINRRKNRGAIRILKG